MPPERAYRLKGAHDESVEEFYDDDVGRDLHGGVQVQLLAGENGHHAGVVFQQEAGGEIAARQTCEGVEQMPST